MSTRMDGDDFVNAFRRGMGGVTSTEWPDADCLRMINLAQIHIASSVLAQGEDIPALEDTEDITTVAAQEEYTLSADDVLKVLYLSSDAQPRLKKKDRDYRLRIGSVSSSDPWAWYESGGSNDGTTNISLIGTPSEAGKTITVYYAQIPREIVISPTANTSILPQSYDLAIVQRAVVIAKSLSVQVYDASRHRSFAQEAEAAAANTLPGSIEHVWPIGGFPPGTKE